MTQSLAQLQAEWREDQKRFMKFGGAISTAEAAVYGNCAHGLQPHVEREASAQAKSLADERRTRDAEHITDLLIEICDHSPPVLLMHRISALAGEAKAYRTQYPASPSHQEGEP